MVAAAIAERVVSGRGFRHNNAGGSFFDVVGRLPAGSQPDDQVLGGLDSLVERRDDVVAAGAGDPLLLSPNRTLAISTLGVVRPCESSVNL